MEVEELFKAVKAASLETIRDVLSRGVDVNTRNSRGDTALHVALGPYTYHGEAKSRAGQVVRCLIEAGADVNLEDGRGYTPLGGCRAACFNTDENVDNIKALILAGADVNHRETEYQWTALHFAASIKNLELVQLMLKNKADVNIKDKAGQTALHWASSRFNPENFEVVQALLAAGADPNAVDDSGNTALHVLMRHRVHEFDYELIWKIVELFASHKADFGILDKSGVAAVHYLMSRKPEHEFYVRLVETFSQHGLDTTTTFDLILRKAISEGNLPLVEHLLDHGADVDALQDDLSLLELAVRAVKQESDLEVVERLLERNPDLTAKDGRHVLNYSTEPPEFLWKAIVAHVAKRRSIDEDSVDPRIIESIVENSTYKEFFEQCNEELRGIMDCKLETSTLLDFESDNDEFDRHATYEELIGELDDIYIAANFSIYGKGRTPSKPAS